MSTLRTAFGEDFMLDPIVYSTYKDDFDTKQRFVEPEDDVQQWDIFGE